MKKIAVSLTFLLSLLGAGKLYSLSPYGFESFIHLGHVFARGTVKDKDGKPRWAEYNSDGGHSELKQFSGESGFVISANAIRNYQSTLNKFSERMKGNVEIYSFEEYKDIQLLTVDDRPISDLPELEEKNGSIALVSKDRRFSDDGEQLEHYIFPIDIREIPEIDSETISILFSEKGEFIYQSDNRIGYLTAFYSQGISHNVDDEVEYRTPSSFINLSDVRKDYNVLQPLTGVYIEVTDGNLNPAAVSGPEGEYTLRGLLTPCPGFSYSSKIDAYAHLSYSNFHPKGSPSVPYYIKKSSYNTCIGFGTVDPKTINIILGAPENITNLNYPVGINVIAGRAYIPEVDVTDSTTYEAEVSPKNLFMIEEDFDGDGEIDEVVRGDVNSDKKFEANADGKRYGVFFSSGKRQDGQPDLIRVMDVEQHLTDQGLLKTISEDDLKDTDILIFRESTGDLITERKGVSDDELLYGVSDSGIARNKELGYQMAIRSLEDTSSAKSWVFKNFVDWQTKTKMNPKLQKFHADFLRAGEKIRVVLLNRATGYMGSKVIELSNDKKFGDITLRVPVIELAPPNLKVWATRRVQGHGILKNSDEDRYTISNEGAATTDDIVVELHTEWLDQDGYPLPTGLTGRGFTGRLAKQIQEGGDSSGDVYEAAQEFSIDPGRHLQVLELDGNEPFHYYLQVNGNMDAEQNDFAAGDHTGELRHRPNKYVPVRVPLYDEQGTIDDRLAIAKAEPKEGEEEIKESDVPSRFNWVTRPEYSFSMIDIAVNEVQLKGEEDDAEPINILEDKTPVISSSDDLVRVLFNLIGSEYERITPIDGDRQYIFALGENEIEVKISKGDAEDKTVEFTNLDHLAQLDVEDYLTLSLYLNQDSQNVLWEWGFLNMGITVADDDVLTGSDSVYVNADNPVLNLSAVIHDYFSWDKEQKDEFGKRVQWIISKGDAELSEKVTEFDETGASPVELKLSPQVQNKVVVEAILTGDDDENPRSSKIKVGVVAGKPKSILLSQQGATSIKGIGDVELTAEVRDSNFNLVTNGTGVLFREQGHINVKSTTGITSSGKVKATLTGGSVAGSYAVEAYSGEAYATANVSVSPLNVSVQGIPGSIQAGSTHTLTAKVTGASELGNIFLDMGVDGGMITQRQLTTDSNGELRFQYKAPKKPGDYQLGVKLDLNDPAVFDLTVAPASSQRNLNSSRSFLVAGANSQTDHITNYKEETAAVVHPEELILEIQGSAGEGWNLALNDPHLPNVEPVYFTRFTELFKDATRQYSSVAENVSKAPSHLAGMSSISQNPSTVTTPWQLDKASEFVIANPSYNFWLNLGGEGKILSVANNTLSLSYQNGSLIAVATTIDSEGEQQAVSTSIPGISTGQWYAIAVRVNNGELSLVVDQQAQNTSLPGAVLVYNNVSGEEPWLKFSPEFSGKAAGLRIYDLDAPALMELSELSGVYDDSGNAQVTARLTSPARSQGLTQKSVTVGMNNGVDTTPVNIISNRAINNMAFVLHSVSSETSIHADQVIESMPLNAYFPDPKSGASNYVAGYALENNEEQSLENVLANLAWLKLETKYPSLHDEIETLQRYFADPKHPDLALYAAEYIQEATVQASNGNNFWLRAMATSFKVWGEMAASNKAEADQIAAAIKNRSDFWAWIRILSIPANGWATDSVPVPRPNVTCDKVEASINVGSVLEFSPEPCRMSGLQAASLVQTIGSIDPSVTERQELLTIYATHLLASVREMPLEYKQWFTFQSNTIGWTDSLSPIEKAYAAGPAAVIAYPVRAFLLLLKQSLRKGAGGAPANFIAFLQGGTTSRVSASEFLPAIAYLSSRFNDVSDELCGNDCEKLNKQVSDTVKEDLATWFIGMGLSKNGLVKEEDDKKKSCSIVHANHGKAFELLGTAMYHALHEFGDQFGLDADQYEILLSDPREKQNILKVGLMAKEQGKKDPILYAERQRKPDLVLEGDGEGERIWVEFKSWAYNSKRFDDSKDKRWNGVANAGSAQYTDASRQYFLDFAASQDKLQKDYWDKMSDHIRQSKPAEHKTWFHIWKSGKRKWRKLVKKDKKYSFDTKYTHRNVSTPWIDKGELVVNSDLGKGKPFYELQEFLADISPTINSDMYEATIGKDKEDHHANFVKDQLSENFQGLLKSDIRPYNIPTFLALELNDESGSEAADVLASIMEKIGGGQYVELQKALNSKEITAERVDQLRDKLTEEMENILGPWAALLVDVPLLSYLENKAADWIVGDQSETIRQKLADYDIPQEYFENICEDQ